MDELDVAIVREIAHPRSLQWNVRISYAEIARGIGADEETVRSRVLRLQESGLLRGWRAAVNASAFGRSVVRFDLPPVPPERLARVEEVLRALDGGIVLFEMFGGRLSLIAYQEQGAAIERQAALLTAVAGAPVEASVLGLPHATVDLKPQDWRIVQGLREHSRANLAELAGALGVTERTLRRRVERLTSGRAIYLAPEFDLSRLVGLLPCEVRVVHADGSPREAIDAELRAVPRTIFQWFEPPTSTVSFNAQNLGEVESLRRRLDALAAGRAKIQVSLLLRRVSLHAWLDEQIARRAVP